MKTSLFQKSSSAAVCTKLLGKRTIVGTFEPTWNKIFQVMVEKREELTNLEKTQRDLSLLLKPENRFCFGIDNCTEVFKKNIFLGAVI